MSQLSRRELLIASASGFAGLAAGAVGYRYLRRAVRLENLYDIFPVGSVPSYADSGEDIITYKFLNDPRWVGGKRRNIEKPTYLDIGAAHPVNGNNTYLFYMKGSQGVLVEPNPVAAAQLRAKRPRDTVLNVGVGVTAQKEADFYCFENSAWNTFDKERAEERAAAGHKYDRVMKMPLVPINQIMEENMGGKAPDFLSTDVEGLDLAILKSLDLERFRPKVICAETILEDLSRGLMKMSPEITDYLSGKGYEARGVTYYNTLYVDTQYFT